MENQKPQNAIYTDNNEKGNLQIPGNIENMTIQECWKWLNPEGKFGVDHWQAKVGWMHGYPKENGSKIITVYSSLVSHMDKLINNLK